MTNDEARPTEGGASPEGAPVIPALGGDLGVEAGSVPLAGSSIGDGIAVGGQAGESSSGDEVAAPPDLDLFGHAPRGRRDWSHRRGEPRVFALLWTMFLTVIATGTLMRAAVGGRLDVTVYRGALRGMLLVVVTGIVVGWPLLRLSQARPRGGGVRSTLKDVLILLVPLQAVLWPQAILAHWPASVVAGVDGLMAVWALMCGGVVAIALGGRSEDPEGLPDAEVSRPDPGRGRTGAMAIVVGLGAIGGASAFVLDTALRDEAADGGAWWMMLSPHTGIAELTRDWSAWGEAARTSSGLFWMLTGQLVAGLMLWGVALGREWAGGRRAEGD